MPKRKGNAAADIFAAVHTQLQELPEMERRRAVDDILDGLAIQACSRETWQCVLELVDSVLALAVKVHDDQVSGSIFRLVVHEVERLDRLLSKDDQPYLAADRAEVTR